MSLGWNQEAPYDSILLFETRLDQTGLYCVCKSSMYVRADCARCTIRAPYLVLLPPIQITYWALVLTVHSDQLQKGLILYIQVLGPIFTAPTGPYSSLYI